MFSKAEKIKRLEMVVALLEDADAMLQGTLGDSEECYFIATQIQNAADDVTDIVTKEAA
jgi:hypothetical protein